MSTFKQNLLKRNHTEVKNFSYTNGRMSLNFSIDVSSKKDVADFLEMLKVGAEELGEFNTKK